MRRKAPPLRRSVRAKLGAGSPSAIVAEISPATLKHLKDVRGLTERRKAENLLGQIRRLANEFRSSEERFDLILRKLLFRANPALRILRLDKQVVILNVAKLPQFPKLAPPYGYKGGAARATLVLALNTSRAVALPRDLDIVRISAKSDLSPTQKDEELASKYMPEDFSHGYGIEVLDSFESYLSSRDLTINEVLVMGGALICSPDCLKDHFAKVIRPSARYREGMLPSGLALKMIRFAIEKSLGDEAWHIPVPLSTQECAPFDLCLHLSRIIPHGDAAASAFLASVQRYGNSDIKAHHLESPLKALEEFGGVEFFGKQALKELATPHIRVPSKARLAFKKSA